MAEAATEEAAKAALAGEAAGHDVERAPSRSKSCALL